MDNGWTKNFDSLAITPNRKIALAIMSAGLDSINTEKVINSSFFIIGDTLMVKEKSFNLNEFKNIKVIGFGKSSVVAAREIERILGSKINEGAVIGLEKINLKYIETFAGTHPRPTEKNIEAGQKIHEIIKNSDKEDLIIAIVSGGGSALLCDGEEECTFGAKLYDSFLKSGKTIAEINIVRKHLSILKGGGLAKLAYPATVIGLIFSDVPGDNFETVASGPTYKDTTTVFDAQMIITENNLGDFSLIETPKEDKYFEKVHNFVLVSNNTAVDAMVKKSKELNLETEIVSTVLYDEVNNALKKIFSKKDEKINDTNHGKVFLAAGEPAIVVPKDGGKGGRNLHMALEAINNKMINKKENNKESNEEDVFLSFASDGMDNSDAAGAIVDKETIEKAEKLNLNVEDYTKRCDSYNFFEKTGDIIFTGPTNANVSDLMILLHNK